MYRLTRIAALTLVAAAACAKKEAPPAKPEPVAVAKPAEALDCDRLLPGDVRAAHFPQAVLKANLQDRTATCELVSGEQATAQVEYHCRATDTLASFEATAKASTSPGIAGLGRGAYGDDRHLSFYDDDTDCEVSVTDQATGKDALPLARDVARALKPELVPALPAPAATAATAAAPVN